MEATKDIKVEVIARENIKPSSPTPHRLRNYKLSARDQVSPPDYISVVFFYAATASSTIGGEEILADARSQKLKKSLCETLTHFYPLAGRLSRENLTIDCNDEGVDYLYARVINCRLSDILEQPKFDDIIGSSLIQTERLKEEDFYYKSPPLLIIQANVFPCGGMAVGVSMSHKIADGVTFFAFVKAWSCTALESPETVLPDFTAASSRFPPIEDIRVRSIPFGTSEKNATITRRFVVNASKITALKAKVASESVEQPTRVEAVTAFVWKCAVTTSKARLKGSSRPALYAMTGAVDLRSRLAPPLPKHSFGNVLGLLWAMLNDDDGDDNDDNDLPARLVRKLRNGVEKSTDKNWTNEAKKLMQLKGDEIELYRHTSWCRFPLYEADFGWGKPTWVTRAILDAPVGILLMDERDGEGVEVLLTLVEEDMAVLEGDKELRAFASINPSAL